MSAFRETTLLTEDQKHEFCGKMEEALDLREEGGKMVWNCRHDYEFAHARRSLDQLGLTVEDSEKFLELCKEHGGHCDCEILLNVVGAADDEIAEEMGGYPDDEEGDEA